MIHALVSIDRRNLSVHTPHYWTSEANLRPPDCAASRSFAVAAFGFSGSVGHQVSRGDRGRLQCQEDFRELGCNNPGRGPGPPAGWSTPPVRLQSSAVCQSAEETLHLPILQNNENLHRRVQAETTHVK